LDLLRLLDFFRSRFLDASPSSELLLLLLRLDESLSEELSLLSECWRLRFL